MEEDEPDRDERFETIDTVLESWSGDVGVPGASVVVTDPDVATWAAGVGARDLESNDRVSE